MIKKINRRHRRGAALLMALGTFVLSSGAMAAEKMDEYSLAEMLVEGSRTMPGGMVDREIHFSILGNTDYMEVPANVVSYTEKAIRQNTIPTRTFLNTMTNHPSILVGGASTNNNVELQIRGARFNTHDMLMDGVPGMMAMGIIPMNWVERIDTIIGPNVVLSGVGVNQSVSGFVNFAPKTAQEKRTLTLTETYSSDHHFTHDIDFGQRFGKNHQYGIRINAEIYAGDTSIDKETLRGKDFYIHLDQRSDWSRTSFIYGYDSVKHHGMPEVLNVGKKWGGTVTGLPAANRVVENFMPSWSELSHSRNVYTLTHDQKLAEHLWAYVKLGYEKLNWPGYLDQKPILLNDAGAYDFGAFGFGSGQDSYWKRKTLTLGLNADFVTGSVKHKVNFGYEYLSNYWYGLNATPKRSFPGGNIYTGLTTDIGAPIPVSGPWYLSSGKSHRSFALSDSLSAFDDKLKVILGLRRQTIQTKSYKVSGEMSASYDKTQVSPFIGVLYKLSDLTSVYANYAEGLSTVSPPSTVLNNREVMPPVRTKQYEIGAKWDFKDWGMTVSYFDIKQPTGITNAANIFVMDGETQNRGVEWNVFGKVVPRLSVVGGVMFLDAKYNRSQGGSNDGHRVHGTPAFNLTMGLNYETPVPGLTLNLRGMYCGSSYADKANRISVPSWTRFDFGAQYETKIGDTPASFSVMCYNLFDKRYWSTATTSYAEGMVMLNPGRTFSEDFGYFRKGDN